jgi:hypothetical protein
MWSAPKTMHGCFRSALVHLTSPTNFVSPNIVSGLEMSPLIPMSSSAAPVAAFLAKDALD